MKKRTAKKIFFTIAAICAPPSFFLFNIARYLAPDAVVIYTSIILLFLVLFLRLGKGSFSIEGVCKNFYFAAFHASVFLSLCYFYGVDSRVGKGAFPTLAIFFIWLMVKILFVSGEFKKLAQKTIIISGIIASAVAVWVLFPFPLNYLPVPVFFLCVPLRLLVKKFFPKQRLLTVFFSYLFLFVSLIIIMNYITARHGRTANYLVALIFLFEILYGLRAYRALKNTFVPAVMFLDLAVLINIVIPAYGKYFNALTGLVTACFFLGVITLKGLGLHIAPRKIVMANYVVLLSGVVAVGAILYSRATPCDYSRLTNDFRIITRSEGAYDMVLSPDGRYLYAVFGDPVHTLEKFDLTGAEKTITYKFEEESAEPERLILDLKRGRVVVSVWGEPNMKLAVFNADDLNLISVMGGESLPHNPDNIKADAAFDYYYVLGERIGEVAKVNAETLETEKFGRSHLGIAYGMCLDEKRELLYSSSWIGPFITVFNINSMKPKYRFRSEIVNAEINCDSKTGKVYAGNFINNFISVYDMKESDKRIRKIPSTFGARDLALDDAKRMIISGTYFTGVLEGIDIDTGKKLFGYKPGNYIRGIEYEQKSGRLFVACRCGIYELNKSVDDIPK